MSRHAEIASASMTVLIDRCADAEEIAAQLFAQVRTLQAEIAQLKQSPEDPPEAPAEVPA